MKNPTEPKDPPVLEKKPTLVSWVMKEINRQPDLNQSQPRNGMNID